MALVLAAGACTDDYTLDDQSVASLTPIHTDLTYFKDAHGRYMTVHGVNVSGSSKFPAAYNPVSFVGKPFPLEEADWNFRMLRELGFNTIRLVMTWEAIEHEGPGIYDVAYLDYIEQIVAKAEAYGIYCLMDMHQDMFSRHIYRIFDDGTEGFAIEDPADIAKAEPFGLNNLVRGDGAPEWVVQLCLPEKDVGGAHWGLPIENACGPRSTSAFFPFTLWGLNIFISLDVNRTFATFFAGSDIYPDYEIMGENIQDYLQGHFAGAWREVARRVAKYPNVIGYDILNEPAGLYIVFTLYALFWNEAAQSPDGELTDEQVSDLMDVYMADLWGLGIDDDVLTRLDGILVDYDIPPRSTAQIMATGFVPEDQQSPYRPDLDAALGLNINFNRNYLQPMHERVSAAILAEDPGAILWLELSLGQSDTGILGMMASPMLRPEGVEQIAFGPHYYTDIYPMIGFNQPPRDFTVEEVRFRDYSAGIETAVESSTFSLGNPPTVMGEFGTYYNFGGIEASMAQDYAVSAHILDNYYEAYEEMGLHTMLWCYSPENTMEEGEGWNKEDFSLLGPDRKPRAEFAYSRPYARFTSGKPVSSRFYSDYHYYDPDPYLPDPLREFEVTFKVHETMKPTEIFVPPVQYPDGFFVYLSDGYCHYDSERFILYYYPTERAPQTVHTLRMRPPYPDYGDQDWRYFFDGDNVLVNP